ncbi:MAG: hypothetical protein GQ574_26220 [Crocinitomix sp.]|nr:hypothetical protein [Crocinitomix sp.]
MPISFSKKVSSFITLLLFSQLGFSQFNDTLFYQSGNFKVVEITSRTTYKIEYRSVNENGDTTFEFKMKGQWSFELNIGMGSVYQTKTSNFSDNPGTNIDLGFIKRFGKKNRTMPLRGNKMQ